MEVSLHAILSHKSFDWSCRTSKLALVSNLEEIVKDIGNLKQVETSTSSPLFKAATKIYNLVKKRKNANKGKDLFVTVEEDTLKKYEVKVEERQVEEKVEEQFEEKENVKEKDDWRTRKRKNFNELKSAEIKKARLANVVDIIKADAGLEEEVFHHMKREREASEEKRSKHEEDFKLCCLNLMKTLRLSETKYDDLRWWIKDVLERGYSLSHMPASTTLKAKVNKEMVPPNMSSSETGAEFELTQSLFHTGRRFLERPDIKEHLKEGDTVVHLAKVGADFCTGFGKVQQRKQSDFDEDGSHNTGFQTIKLSLPHQTLFTNKAPGGSELLRLISKTNHKDSQARMIEQMEFLDKACKEMPEQEVEVEGVGKVAVQHQLVNCLHDGKERLAIVQHKVRKSKNT